MSDYEFGVHILESLTIGMYQDSRTIFREYIQNASDAIDDAVRQGVIVEGGGEIRITIDPEARNVIIEDNGTGVSAVDFERVMKSIADSDKRPEDSRGFRGIGKLCGLAYCETLVFTAKFKGEDLVSELVCDAKKLRSRIAEAKDSRYTAVKVLDDMNHFSTHKTDDIDAHYFRVELRNVNKESSDLTTYVRVKEYLECTAPLPYASGFAEFDYRIHDHAKELGLTISEYNIFLNDDQLFKSYTREFSTSKGGDEAFDIMFEDFLDDDGNIMAWAWVGISCLEAQISRHYPIRGIRLRKGNIQVGDESTIQRFFTEERGNNYFIGEVFCVSDDLVPNARRDYFNENEACKTFEDQARRFCFELGRLYRDGSKLNSSLRKAKAAEDKAIDLRYQLKKDYFADEEGRSQAEEQLLQTQKDAEKLKGTFARTASKNDTLSRIAERIQQKDTQFTQGGGGFLLVLSSLRMSSNF